MRVRYIEFIAALRLMITPCQGQGTISTVAGTGTFSADADGVVATSAYSQGADGVTVDNTGNLFIWEVSIPRAQGEHLRSGGSITMISQGDTL